MRLYAGRDALSMLARSKELEIRRAAADKLRHHCDSAEDGLKLEDDVRRDFTITISRQVAERLQRIIETTNSDASTIVGLALEMFFESLPGAEIVQKLRLLEAARGITPN